MSGPNKQTIEDILGPVKVVRTKDITFSRDDTCTRWGCEQPLSGGSMIYFADSGLYCSRGCAEAHAQAILKNLDLMVRGEDETRLDAHVPAQANARTLIDQARHIYLLVSKQDARDFAHSSSFRCVLRGDKLYITHPGKGFHLRRGDDEETEPI